MFTLRTHPSKDAPTAPDFYIQSVGESAGRPMRSPSANCWEVYTDKSVLLGDYFFYMVQNLHQTGRIAPLLRGTAIPYITMEDFYSLFY